MTRGQFISLEGGEGAGKSTQIRKLVERLRAQGVSPVATREPGGSPGAEAIRELLVKGAADRWSATTEALLMYAARRDHVERLIQPALARGDWVICDRFADSTRAYQAGAGGAGPALIAALEAQVLDGAWPDLTVILDLPAEVGLARAKARGDDEGRFEAKGLEFHQRLREAYLRIARDEPGRCVVVDAVGDIDTVAGRIWAAVEPRTATA